MTKKGLKAINALLKDVYPSKQKAKEQIRKERLHLRKDSKTREALEDWLNKAAANQWDGCYLPVKTKE